MDQSWIQVQHMYLLFLKLCSIWLCTWVLDCIATKPTTTSGLSIAFIKYGLALLCLRHWLPRNRQEYIVMFISYYVAPLSIPVDLYLSLPSSVPSINRINSCLIWQQYQNNFPALNIECLLMSSIQKYFQILDRNASFWKALLFTMFHIINNLFIKV